ncbi:MAG: pentapeptide repeat-containing protein, partial [bacterium]
MRRSNLTSTDLKRKNLQSTNISRSILRRVALSDTYLSSKDLSRVDLSDSDLSRVQALGTDFFEAILNGACIEDWHINYTTKLDGIICDYIYLKSNQQERRPHDPSKVFASGEFARLFQKAIETVDLIFRNGINWEAFAYSFRQLQIKVDTEDVSIQTIENKGDGYFVIRVNTPLGLNKVETQRFIEREYQDALKA